MLALAPEDEFLGGPFTRVWDRAALVALDPARRARYASVVASLLAPGAELLLDTFVFDGARKPGPPHAVPGDEIRALWPRANAERVSVQDITAESVARGWGVSQVLTETWRLRFPLA